LLALRDMGATIRPICFGSVTPPPFTIGASGRTGPDSQRIHSIIARVSQARG